MTALRLKCVIPARSVIIMKIGNFDTSYVARTGLSVIPAKAGIYAVVGLFLLIASACTGPAVPAHPEYGVVVVTRDLAQGSNRVVFGLVDVEGMPVRSDQAQVQASFCPRVMRRGSREAARRRPVLYSGPPDLRVCSPPILILTSPDSGGWR